MYLYLLLTRKRVSLRHSWSRKCHQWMVEPCRKCHWLTAVTPTGTASPRSCQELPWSWSSATKLLTSPASVLCLTWLGAVWTQSSSLIPGGRCQRGLMSLPREKALTYTVAIRQTRTLRNSRLGKPWQQFLEHVAAQREISLSKYCCDFVWLQICRKARSK